MNRRLLCLWAIAAGLTLLALSLPIGAMAAGCGCSAPVTPTVCCKQPTPPSVPTQPCCGSGGNNIIVPGVNVYVSPSVLVDVTANANASASAAGSASASGAATGLGTAVAAVINAGGGGSSFYESGGSVGAIQGLNVESGVQRSAYQASRTRVRIVVIQAFCLDDKDVPHPASQVTPDRELSDSYAGEIYRCIAGTRMQWTMADYQGRIDFSQGQTTTCNKNEALVMTRAPGQSVGAVQCMTQKPARDCNERSLLRRFGAGVKIIKIVTTETYTAYREEQTRTASSSSFDSMMIDGGVGGVAH